MKENLFMQMKLEIASQLFEDSKKNHRRIKALTKIVTGAKDHTLRRVWRKG